MRIESLARFPLAQLPTPIEELKSLSRELGGPELLIKRDDQTGLALGGNKTRKLEFLVGQAVEQDADTLVTAGAAQSNHCRQTAAAAARAGLRCELLLNGTKPELPNGNVLLDELLGARSHWIQPSERAAKLRELPDQLRKGGRKPYVIPVGGSNGVGATGYVLAMIELVEQLGGINRRVDHVVFASSSGGTQAGMVVGAKVTGFDGKLHGVSIDRDDRRAPYEHELADIANETAKYIGYAGDSRRRFQCIATILAVGMAWRATGARAIRLSVRVSVCSIRFAVVRGSAGPFSSPKTPAG
jgi:D-cysteine desulfhydrase